MPNIANRILRKQHSSNRTRSQAERVNMGEGVYLPRDSILDAKKITIGDYTRINGKIQIIASGEATIGKYCAIGRDVLIITSNHVVFRASVQLVLYLRMFKYDNVETRGAVEIGSDVWIGDRVVMVPGAKIRDGCVIGAGSVVTKEIPPYSIAVGVPAKVIRSRFPENTVEQLLKIKWWDWEEERIKRNRDFFLADLRDPSINLNSLIKE